MKKIQFFMLSFAFLISLVSASVFANTTDLYEFLYSGAEASKNVTMKTEVTRTEMRSVQDWCTRTICPRPAPGCPPGRPGCRPPGPVGCRTQTYRCVRQVPVQVFDHYVENLITMTFSGDLDGVSELFKLTQTGSALTVKVDSSKRVAIFLSQSEQGHQRRGDLVSKRTSVNFQMMNLDHIYAAKEAGITDLELKDGLLTFVVAKSPVALDLDLKLLRRRSLASDIVLFDRVLGPNDFKSITDLGNKIQYQVLIKDLGVTIPEKLTLSLSYGFMNVSKLNLLNDDELKELYTNRTIKYTF